MQKPYAKKMEYIAKVWDGSRGEVGDNLGYWGCMAVACESGGCRPVPLASFQAVVRGLSRVRERERRGGGRRQGHIEAHEEARRDRVRRRARAAFGRPRQVPAHGRREGLRAEAEKSDEVSLYAFFGLNTG